MSCGKCVLKMCVESILVNNVSKYTIWAHSLNHSPHCLSPFLLPPNSPFSQSFYDFFPSPNVTFLSLPLPLSLPFPPPPPLPLLVLHPCPSSYPICLQSVASCLCEVSLQAQETSRYHLISTLTKLVFVDLPSSNTAIPLDTPLRCVVCTCHEYGT